MTSAEDLLAWQMKAVGIAFDREYRFAAPRRFRADFLVEAPGRGTDVLIEVDGGAFSGGRHTTGAGFRADAEKASLAAVAGYRVIRCLPEHVESGECLRWIEAAR